MDSNPYPAAMTKTRKTLAVGLAALALTAIACSSSPSKPTTKAGGSDPAQAAEVGSYEPTKLDFALSVKVTRKKCFGSAGCNVTYHIDMEYKGAKLDDSKTYRVTYEVTGVEDGPAVNSFEVTGDQWSYDEEENAQTASSTAKLKAKVTDVEEA